MHKIVLDLEEEYIDSYDVLHWPYVRYLNDDHDTTLKKIYLHITLE